MAPHVHLQHCDNEKNTPSKASAVTMTSLCQDSLPSHMAHMHEVDPVMSLVYI